jgi:hypothetical protein
MMYLWMLSLRKICIDSIKILEWLVAHFASHFPSQCGEPRVVFILAGLRCEYDGQETVRCW